MEPTACVLEDEVSFSFDGAKLRTLSQSRQKIMAVHKTSVY
jgi:hypothetical protein